MESPAGLTRNCFELFELPARFELDVDELTRRYKQSQREVHPDRFVNCGETEQRIAMQKASLLNEAYKTLREPLARAAYLLKLAGIDVKSSQGAQLEPGFLMEQMEFREAMQSLGKTAEPLRKLKTLQRQIDGKTAALFEACMQALDRRDYHAAAETVRKLQFYNKLQHEADELALEYE